MSFKLTPDDREKIFGLLREAPDSVLLEAAEFMKQEYVHIQQRYGDVKKFIGLRSIALTDYVAPDPTYGGVEPPPENPPPTKAKAKVARIEPAGEIAGRIGAKNRDAIIGCLRRAPNTLDGVATYVKVNKTHIAPLIKLLWSRGEVQFDGERYSL